MTVKSRFQMVDYEINEFSLKQNLSRLKQNASLVYDFTKFVPEVNVEKDGENQFSGETRLTIDITAKQGRYVIRKIHLVITGYFKGVNTTEEEFKRICSLSGVINLLSLARSYIATATSTAGGPPAIMPFLDLTAKKEK